MEFPCVVNKHYQRSKSQKFKRKYIESDVVNEETIEDDDLDSNQNKVKKRRPLQFSNVSLNDDLPSRFSRSLAFMESLKNHNPNNPRSMNMDPVVEVKEEDKEAKDGRQDSLSKGMGMISLNSPRIKYLTDIKEDSAINTHNFIPTTLFHMHKDYSLTVETDEIIAEDNNENLIDNTETVKKRESFHKLLENVIDKEDNYPIQELNVNCGASSNAIFETIKEENIEEEEKDVIPHNKTSGGKKIIR